MKPSLRRSTNLLISMVVLISMLFPGVQPNPASAQAQDDIHREYNAETGKVAFIAGEGRKPVVVLGASALGMTPEAQSLALVQRFAPEFGLTDPSQELRLSETDQPRADRVVSKYQQVYQGVPVMAGELIVNANKRGELISINGEVSAGLALDTNPKMTVETAIEIAKKGMVKWYGGDAKDYSGTQASLWIFDETLLRPSLRPVELVWRIEMVTTQEGAPIRELVLVDAKTGNISLHFNQVDTVWAGLAQDASLTKSPAESPLPMETPISAEANINSASPEVGTLAVTLYVKASGGSDANTCLSADLACATISGALDKAAVSGDTIKVSAGLYTGIAATVNITKSIAILGGWNSDFSVQTGFSILDGAGTFGTLIEIKANTSVERLIIRNGMQGIFISDGGTCPNQVSVTMRQSSIIGMTYGGAISNCGILSLVNSTISNNKGSFGAIDNFLGTINIQNSTIVNNSSTGGQFLPGGIKSTDANGIGSVTIENSILAENFGYGGEPHDCGGTVTSAGHNVIGTLYGCTITTQANDQIGVDPKLGLLLPNGYIPLLSNSPAIDGGSPLACSSADQRGVARPQGAACDIGAYEYIMPGTGASFDYFDGSNQQTAPMVAFPLPLSVYVLDINGSPVPNVTVTFTAPFSGVSGIFSNSTRFDTVTSNINGVATSSAFTANNQLGSYTVTATSSGMAGSVDFSMANVNPWFVAPTGSDFNNCASAATACLTINGAINKAASGDVIEIAEGTYTGSGTEVVLIAKSIRLYGGWNESFSAQSGISRINGQGLRRGIKTTAGPVVIDHFTIQNGYGDIQGGGIHNNGILTLNNSIVRGNYSLMGGGIFNIGGTITINNSMISENSSGQSGTGGSGGGGIMTWGGHIVLNNSVVNGNAIIGQFFGSGIYNGANSFVLNNSIVSGNTGVEGIANYGKLILNNSTVSNNQFYGIDNGLGTGSVVLQNSIVARNGANGDCRGPINSQGYNLIGNGSGCGFNAATGDLVGTSANPINPRLTPLRNNGGSTLTLALMDGSPALNSGSPAVPGSGGNACLETDQRGVIRPVAGRCDMGAYEGIEAWTPTPFVDTFTVANNYSLPPTFLCNQTDPNCIAGDAHAKAAHQYALGTYDLYAVKHRRDSLDNNGMTITSLVHYCSPGYACPYDNAFWSGTYIVYGDALGFPLADDVVAHELTHGVTQYESDLFYFYQSGAINESFSDVWGEYYDQINGLGNDTTTVKWLIGEDVSGSSPIRSLSNPPVYGDPDRMTSANYDKTDLDNGGVHTNSGVNNKAAFLMVDGGVFNGRYIATLGWDKTTAIYYEAQTNLLSSGSDYSDLYFALQQACVNLIGLAGITTGDCQQVRNALDAVEMNSQPVPNFNQDAPVCASGLVPTIFYQDNMETVKYRETSNAWSLQTGYASSPDHMIYGDDLLPGNTSTAMLVYTVLPASPAMYLHFKHAFAFEYFANEYYDGGVLEYSIDDGFNWLDAASLFMDGQNYKGTIMDYPGTLNTLKGRSGFVGDSHGYVSSRYNLSSLAGKIIKFRWKFATDNSYYYLGWMVDDVQIYSCDAPPPSVSSILHANFNPNNLASVQYTVNFSKSVTGVDISDFSLTTSGVSGAAMSGISGSGSVYTVTVNTGNGDGSIRLNLVDDNSIIDSSSRPLGGAGIGDGSFTNGEPYTITKSLAGVTAGVFRPGNGLLYLKNAHISGFADVAINYGTGGDYPIAGDWDGNGTATIGIYRNGSFYLRNSNTLGFADLVFAFGTPGDQPVAGDWDGDGVDTIGVYSNGQFLLRNSNSVGAEDMSFYLGNPGDVGIAGDWNGDGSDTTGVFRPSNGVIFLKNANTSGFADVALNYGLAGDQPVIGDWNDDGIDTIGVYRNAQFLLRNSNTIGFADIVFALGNPGDMPIAGNWDGIP